MAKRKRKYVPGIAQINFKPNDDWEPEEAQKLYRNADHPGKVDEIIFDDCIIGMQNLPADYVDLVIADPPFGIDFSGKEHFYNRNSEYVQEGYRDVEGDYGTFTQRWMKELPRIMKNTASAYIFSGWTNLLEILVAGKKANLELINHIVWKYPFGVFTKRKFVTSHYHILLFVKNPQKYYFNKIEHYPLDVWEISRNYKPGQKKNGTKLPEEVITRAINFSSKPGDLVFDPFMGNGTTAVSAKTNYRHFLGYEINKSMKEILRNNLDSVADGQNYQPYRTYLPTLEELAEKYPAIKKVLESKKGN
ncbi:MAG: DNA-methyltransferase [Promethearchaeota archaeon]